MKKISVIIPIYNTVNCLTKCLDSVCNQTYTALEIICIDDGSTDGSEIIVDKFSKKDSRIRLICQENHGESHARNVGVKKATGDYITFVDCDDWIESTMYEEMMVIMEKEKVDLVASSWFEEGKTSKRIENKKSPLHDVFGKQKLLEYIYERDSYRGFAYLWDKLYKRELFYNEYGQLILFDENLKLGGDVLYLARLALNVERAIYMDKAFYHYRQREDSGCHSTDLEKRQDWIKAYIMLLHMFADYQVDAYILDLVKRFLAYHSSNLAQLAYEQNNKKFLLKGQAMMRQYGNEYRKMNKDKKEYLERFDKILGYKLM